MFYFRYMVEGGGDDDFLPVATTRPETILGDTAVAVHPEDARYSRFVGKRCRVPLSDRCPPTRPFPNFNTALVPPAGSALWNCAAGKKSLVRNRGSLTSMALCAAPA